MQDYEKTFAPMSSFRIENGMVFEIDGAPEENSLIRVEDTTGEASFRVRGVTATYLNVSLDDQTYEVPADLSIRLVPGFRLGMGTGTMLDKVLE